MKQYYTRLQIICDPDFSEILMAEIAEAGFDTFMETEKGFEAYGEEGKTDRKQVEEIQLKYKHVNPLLLLFDKIEKQNWNEEWEKNVDPIVVDDRILVRAYFHKIEKKYPYEIIITPKMSFGTGHHQTTHLMLRSQLQIDHNKKKVMDAGCGTAILSVMSVLLGARSVEAFDIDEWSITNGRENAEVNGTANINIRLGTIRDFNFKNDFDVILANINKNVLMDEMAIYGEKLLAGGTLLLSGFYVKDTPDILWAASKQGLAEVRRDSLEEWAALTLKKYL